MQHAVTAFLFVQVELWGSILDVAWFVTRLSQRNVCTCLCVVVTGYPADWTAWNASCTVIELRACCAMLCNMLCARHGGKS